MYSGTKLPTLTDLAIMACVPKALAQIEQWNQDSKIQILGEEQLKLVNNLLKAMPLLSKYLDLAEALFRLIYDKAPDTMTEKNKILEEIISNVKKQDPSQYEYSKQYFNTKEVPFATNIFIFRVSIENTMSDEIKKEPKLSDSEITSMNQFLSDFPENMRYYVINYLLTENIINLELAKFLRSLSPIPSSGSEIDLQGKLREEPPLAPFYPEKEWEQGYKLYDNLLEPEEFVDSCYRSQGP